MSSPPSGEFYLIKSTRVLETFDDIELVQQPLHRVIPEQVVVFHGLLYVGMVAE
ncbi:hypothetical protein SpiGrapes_2449 [Sphaerochaeta pleomorpha str. Grapes]|uniref:Uncharacterized protein n=1 Tax=Sphaerochaeta pleomorpha (strain ATCC BAA-1885 / DSM 22778 / Grapes) TaxID=158190 RepID=G8QTH1_SPHPG|nr:hypothetical protein [Sphaerochaeta pleomorpha]AEV30212.1 hypothetical protein SpiGrapes_2449 [Sphaerochaeta pleomorpha str. Grapes]